MASATRTFVWTKMGAEGGQSLPKVVALKEAERQAGGGVFWWGVGNSLGPAVYEAATRSGGRLPVVFTTLLARHKRVDSHPDYVCVWEHWQGKDGIVRPVPSHVLSWSRGNEAKRSHYALVCQSDEPLVLGDDGPFDPLQCRTANGKTPGASQVTALLESYPGADHSGGEYNCYFRADLVKPWFVKLVNPRRMSVDERDLQTSWKKGGDWRAFVRKFHEF